MRTRLVVGNWKMHGSFAFNEALLADVCAVTSAAERAVCVPFPYLERSAKQLEGSAVALGAQDVSAYAQGAYTGEVAAPMLAEVGAKWVIVGHSERRTYHAETSETVAIKAARALDAGLFPIICLGETLDQRESGQTEAVVGAQLDAVLNTLSADQLAQCVLAYEPVWAIGTGKTASSQQAQDVHAFLRTRVATRYADLAVTLRILYGGSVKPNNAAELFAQPDIDGGLIGGAALKADEFLAICNA